MAALLRDEPYKLPAGLLAVLVHGIFFFLLYFSFSWQMKPPQGMVVEIWDNLPEEMEAPPAMPPPPAPAELAANTKVEPAVLPPKADIDLRDKRDRKLKAEKQKLEKTKAQLQAEKQAEMAERRMEELERQAQERAKMQRKAQEQAAIATGKTVDEFIGKIAAKIRRNIVNPPGVAKNIRAEFSVTLLPSGEVLNATLAKSSGNEAYDSAVERAILKAQPLPLPPAEQNLFARFRDLRLKFSPAESGQ